MKTKPKIYGVIPARMAASRFPGKPLHKIKGKAMIEHVYIRSMMYKNWDKLVLATCDDQIINFCDEKKFNSIKTSNKHTRALDRVAEAAVKIDKNINQNDIVVCVQGDEPMMRPDMIDCVIDPIINNDKIPATVLAMHITDEKIWRNPDTVKIIHNDNGEVLYTSRSPVPYIKKSFTPELNARRIYGIFAFRWKELNEFANHSQTRLEITEACDSNRILDMEFKQYIAPYRSIKSFSIDSPSDTNLVESHITQDGIWQEYNK